MGRRVASIHSPCTQLWVDGKDRSRESRHKRKQGALPPETPSARKQQATPGGHSTTPFGGAPHDTTQRSDDRQAGRHTDRQQQQQQQGASHAGEG